jgi:alpha-tubulin suppressor-like RCC1 family protein
MSRFIRGIRVRRPIVLLGLAGAVLGGVSCRSDEVVAPAPTDVAEASHASAATAALAFYQLSGGESHTCGVTLDHRLYCWGGGYLGNGTSNGTSTAPVAVASTLRFQQVSAALSHSCAVTTDYRAYCWGSNANGSLGDGTQTDRLTPVPVAGGLRFRQVEAGEVHTCGVTYLDNRAYCWGYGGDGELGAGTPPPYIRPTPTAVLGGLRFRQVSAGGGLFDRYDRGTGAHTCGVTTSDEAFCWGDNRQGQLGIGGTDYPTVGSSYSPLRVAGGQRFRQIDAGVDYTCAVTTGNRAYCWGNGRWGQIGDGRTFLRYSPRAVAGGHAFDRVTTGKFHTCAETTLNRAYCWGSGYTGDGTTTQRLTPVAVSGGLFFSQVSAGYTQTCGRTGSGVGYCWGTNDYGQLGDGTTTTRLRPVRVVGPR